MSKIWYDIKVTVIIHIQAYISLQFATKWKKDNAKMLVGHGDIGFSLNGSRFLISNPWMKNVFCGLAWKIISLVIDIYFFEDFVFKIIGCKRKANHFLNAYRKFVEKKSYVSWRRSLRIFSYSRWNVPGCILWYMPKYHVFQDISNWQMSKTNVNFNVW